ncbi:MAG TPA: DUF502 domain-containing protein [Bacteroidota bacterium]|nr:DUF502 domain-containing protein [Bacteroidota bacterium]
MNNGDQQQTFLGVFRTAFGRGLVVIIPIVITVWVLNILFSAVDGIISPLFDQALGRHIPGLGFISMVVLILIVGALSRNLIGRTVFKAFERIIYTLPLARTIYSAIKDLINAFQIGGKGKSFRQVVLVEYPRQGLFTIGFMTNEMKIDFESSSSQMVSVYIPNPPNPTSGIMILIPKGDVQVIDMSVEEGLKLVLSGGIVTSGLLTIKKHSSIEKKQG